VFSYDASLHSLRASKSLASSLDFPSILSPWLSFSKGLPKRWIAAGDGFPSAFGGLCFYHLRLGV
jgi:hypothetical protein